MGREVRDPVRDPVREAGERQGRDEARREGKRRRRSGERGERREEWGASNTFRGRPPIDPSIFRAQGGSTNVCTRRGAWYSVECVEDAITY